MYVLTQFIFRVSFGLALGMAVTSPREVTSGYYRNHLYVLLGLNVLATMVALTAPEYFSWTLPVTAAILSYVGSVIWLYEKRQAGILALWLIAAISLAGAWSAMVSAAPLPERPAPPTIAELIEDDTDIVPLAIEQAAWWLRVLDPVTSGLLLGFTLAAMFLGHWYLNTPTMALGPLRRLVMLMAVAIFARAIVCGLGLALAAQQLTSGGLQPVIFVSLRWLSGLAGTALLTGMTWQTLKIPNTQSATGLLYVAVIATFLGELVSMLMSQASLYPI